MNYRSVALCVLLGACAPTKIPIAAATASAAEFRIDLAIAGEGSPYYRIPALAVSAHGTVLAAYDARPTLADLPSNLSVVLRRSRNNGRSWEAPIVVRHEPAPVGFGDPSIVVDRATRRIFVFHAARMNQAVFGSHKGNDENDPDIQQVDLSYSDDDGITWTHRRITKAIKNPDWVSLFASSGAGIQLQLGTHRGSLIQQRRAHWNKTSSLHRACRVGLIVCSSTREAK